MLFYLPALWIALGALALAVMVNESEPLANIARYAIERPFP